jgi:hypothetical protein
MTVVLGATNYAYTQQKEDSMSRIFYILLLPFILGAAPNSEIISEKPLPAPPPLAVVLAQMCVSEISWQKDPRECELQIEINYRNAKRNGISVLRQTKQFNAYFKRPDWNRPWIQHLNAAGTKPDLWPNEMASWKVLKKYWEAYMKVAQDFPKKLKRKGYRPLCPRADDYGGRCDDNIDACDTPKQKCVRPVMCLNNRTKQAYWSRACCRNKKNCKSAPDYNHLLRVP